MSLLPFIMSDPWDEVKDRYHMHDQHLGGGMPLRDLLPNFHGQGRAAYYRPWRHVPGHRSSTPGFNLDEDGFTVVMDVHHFTAEEITVKHVNNCVVVEGKHKETPDEHGYVSRHIVRRYILPENVDGNAITSKLSSDGVLIITAPKISSNDEVGVRTIPVTQTGMPAIKQHGNHPSLSDN